MATPLFTRGDDGIVTVDPGVAYPHYLALLMVKKIDQYWLEVARRCLTQDLVALLGRGLHIRITRAPRWRLKNFPPGKGAEKGASPVEFMEHYRRLAGGAATRLGIV